MSQILFITAWSRPVSFPLTQLSYAVSAVGAVEAFFPGRLSEESYEEYRRTCFHTRWRLWRRSRCWTRSLASQLPRLQVTTPAILPKYTDETVPSALPTDVQRYRSASTTCFSQPLVTSAMASRVVITGYSLGGGLAGIVGAKLQIPGCDLQWSWHHAGSGEARDQQAGRQPVSRILFLRVSWWL